MRFQFAVDQQTRDAVIERGPLGLFPSDDWHVLQLVSAFGE